MTVGPIGEYLVLCLEGGQKSRILGRVGKPCLSI